MKYKSIDLHRRAESNSASEMCKPIFTLSQTCYSRVKGALERAHGAFAAEGHIGTTYQWHYGYYKQPYAENHAAGANQALGLARRNQDEVADGRND